MKKISALCVAVFAILMAPFVSVTASAASPTGSVKEVFMDGFNYAEKGFDIGVVCSVDGMLGRPMVCVVTGVDAQGKDLFQPNGEPVEVFEVFEIQEDSVKDAMVPLVMPQSALKGVKDIYLKCRLFAADSEELLAESAPFHVDQEAMKEKMMNQAESVAGSLIDLFFGGGGGDSLKYDSDGYDMDGYNKEGDRKCYSCTGSGRCSSCGGSGRSGDDVCSSCDGSGVCHYCNGKGNTWM